MAAPDLLESTRPPGASAGGPVHRRIAPRRRLLWALATGAVAVLVVLVVGGGFARHGATAGASAAGRTSTTTPLDRRGPSHPAPPLESVPGGWWVVGQVAGSGVQARTATVQWPAGAQVALLVTCSGGPARIRVNFAGREPVQATPCDTTGTLVSTADLPELLVQGGAPVTVRAADETPGSGAWVVAVLTRVPYSPWSGAS